MHPSQDGSAPSDHVQTLGELLTETPADPALRGPVLVALRRLWQDTPAAPLADCPPEDIAHDLAQELEWATFEDALDMAVALITLIKQPSLRARSYEATRLILPTPVVKAPTKPDPRETEAEHKVRERATHVIVADRSYADVAGIVCQFLYVTGSGLRLQDVIALDSGKINGAGCFGTVYCAPGATIEVARVARDVKVIVLSWSDLLALINGRPAPTH